MVKGFPRGSWGGGVVAVSVQGISLEGGQQVGGQCEWLGTVAAVMPPSFLASRSFPFIVSPNFPLSFGILNIQFFFPLTSHFVGIFLVVKCT